MSGYEHRTTHRRLSTSLWKLLIVAQPPVLVVSSCDVIRHHLVSVVLNRLLRRIRIAHFMSTKELLDGLLLVDAIRAIASKLHTHPQKLVDADKVLNR